MAPTVRDHSNRIEPRARAAVLERREMDTMALREFVDSTGRRWEAYSVIPRDQERRHYDRRSDGVVLEDSDDRRESDRRITVGGRSDLLDGTSGWLAFQHADERRRLTPIPKDWEGCDESQLLSYFEAARPVRASTMHARQTLD